MTLLASSDFGIRGWEGKPYDVGETCAHPKCGRRSAHVHHIWPRSFLRNQPQSWVRFADGTILGNLAGLCVEHHGNLTGELGGYKSRLAWIAGRMVWSDRPAKPLIADDELFEEWELVGMLDPQPPFLGVRAPVAEQAHVHEDGVVCPVCGHHKQTQQPGPKLPRRKTKQWTVTVPDDAELGADILDEMIDDFAIPLGADEWSSRLKRYHVLVAVLAWATVNRGDFIHDMAEAAELRLAGER